MKSRALTTHVINLFLFLYGIPVSKVVFFLVWNGIPVSKVVVCTENRYLLALCLLNLTATKAAEEHLRKVVAATDIPSGSKATLPPSLGYVDLISTLPIQTQ